MRKRMLLSKEKRYRIVKYLRGYLDGIMSQSEYSYRGALREAVRCCGSLDLADCAERWLQGGNIPVEIYTAEVCAMCIRAAESGTVIEDGSLYGINLLFESNYRETPHDVDAFYWRTLAKILVLEGSRGTV